MARNALGRGLGALIRDPEVVAASTPAVVTQPGGGAVPGGAGDKRTGVGRGG